MRENTGGKCPSRGLKFVRLGGRTKRGWYKEREGGPFPRGNTIRLGGGTAPGGRTTEIKSEGGCWS